MTYDEGTTDADQLIYCDQRHFLSDPKGEWSDKFREARFFDDADQAQQIAAKFGAKTYGVRDWLGLPPKAAGAILTK